MPDSAKKTIVLAGGGYASVHVINALESTLDRTKYALVIVNPRPYYLHLISALRAATTADAQLIKDSLMPYDGLDGVVYVQGKAAAVEQAAPGRGGALVLESGERVRGARTRDGLALGGHSGLWRLGRGRAWTLRDVEGAHRAGEQCRDRRWGRGGHRAGGGDS